MATKQNAIVTGAASGIGKAVAHRLSERGINVLVADINIDDGVTVSEDLKKRYNVDSIFVKLDTASEEDAINMVKTAVDRWGRLDWACNCAGKAEAMRDNEDDVTKEDFDRMYEINQRGTWYCQKYEALQMRQQKPREIILTPSPKKVESRGSIVNISSINGIVGLGQPGYSSAKAGILALTRVGAQFYGPYGIRINSILPGSIRTDAMDVWLQTLPEEKKRFVEHDLVNATPLKRQGVPEELANAVSFFLSDDSTFVNGASLVVDGALTAVKY